MNLLGLPKDIVSAVVDQLVLSCNLRDGLDLHHVNRELPNKIFARRPSGLTIQTLV
jgi:hypothetical protein